MTVTVEPGFSLVSIPAGTSAITSGEVLELPKPLLNHTAVCTASAGVATGVVKLAVSQDGVGWVTTAVTVTASTVTTATITGAYRFVAANVTTAFTVGTVAVTVASA